MGLVIRDAEGQGPGLDGRDQAGKWSEEPLGSSQDLEGAWKYQGKCDTEMLLYLALSS